jgi:aryl-phospho-beta-D-glucosidase BglC (GH1 family)
VGTPLALIAAGVITHGTVFGAFGDDAKPKASAATAPVPGNAMAVVAAMQPGWNLGNSLDAPNETNWGRPRTTKALLDSVRAQGLKSIRIPVTWTQIAAAFRNEPAQLVFESINEPQFGPRTSSSTPPSRRTTPTRPSASRLPSSTRSGTTRASTSPPTSGAAPP